MSNSKHTFNLCGGCGPGDDEGPQYYGVATNGGHGPQMGKRRAEEHGRLVWGPTVRRRASKGCAAHPLRHSGFACASLRHDASAAGMPSREVANSAARAPWPLAALMSVFTVTGSASAWSSRLAPRKMESAADDSPQRAHASNTAFRSWLCSLIPRDRRPDSRSKVALDFW